MDETKPRYQVMPPLAVEEFAALKASIAEYGVEVPVVVDAEGNVIDGHHRIQAVEELRGEGHDVPSYPTTIRAELETEEQKREEAWRLNMQRRHLSQAQKRNAIGAKLRESPMWSDSRIGKLLGVDHKTVRVVRGELEARKAIPVLEKLVGADGKEYPRQQARTTSVVTYSVDEEYPRQQVQNVSVVTRTMDPEVSTIPVRPIDAKPGEDEPEDVDEAVAPPVEAPEGISEEEARRRDEVQWLTRKQAEVDAKARQVHEDQKKLQSKLTKQKEKAKEEIEAAVKKARQEQYQSLTENLQQQLADVYARYGIEETPSIFDVPDETWREVLNKARDQREEAVLDVLSKMMALVTAIWNREPEEAARACLKWPSPDRSKEAVRDIAMWLGKVAKAMDEQTAKGNLRAVKGD